MVQGRASHVVAIARQDGWPDVENKTRRVSAGVVKQKTNTTTTHQRKQEKTLHFFKGYESSVPFWPSSK